MLSNFDKPKSQATDEYLLQIKSIADSLAAIKSPISDLDLFNTHLMVLG